MWSKPSPPPRIFMTSALLRSLLVRQSLHPTINTSSLIARMSSFSGFRHSQHFTRQGPASSSSPLGMQAMLPSSSCVHSACSAGPQQHKTALLEQKVRPQPWSCQTACLPAWPLAADCLPRASGLRPTVNPGPAGLPPLTYACTPKHYVCYQKLIIIIPPPHHLRQIAAPTAGAGVA